MAQLTKLQVRTLVQQLIDDPVAKLWSAPNLDIITEASIDLLWGELLDYLPWLRSTEATPTITAPGYINVVTELPRLYRIQIVGRGQRAYNEVNNRDVLLINGEMISVFSHSYALIGDQLHLFPYDATTPVYIRYSSRPATFTSLADSTAVEWPDGYHMAYVYDAASRAIEKGDRESGKTFKNRADEELARLRAYLRKRSIGPIAPWSPETGFDWGGV